MRDHSAMKEGSNARPLRVRLYGDATILRTVRELPSCLTQIVVAHRLSTLEDCDTVVWLDRGRIRMQGPAPEVLAAYRANLGEEGREEPAAKVEK